MINQVGFSQFVDSFHGDYKNNFTYEGKRALFDYLTEYEEDTDTPLELDPIAFCCEFTEYDNLKDLQDQYPDIDTIEELENHTTVIRIHDIHGKPLDSFIIQDY